MIGNKIAFLVHARDYKDLFNKFPILKLFPKSILYYAVKYAPPFAVSKITGLKDKNQKDVEGYVIGIPMTAHQMMEDRDHALKQIRKAVILARKKSVGVIGFGALTASFSKGGLDLVDEINNIGITTGRAYTVKTVTDYVKKCITDFGFEKNEVKIAIVGASGSIGSSCAKMLAKYGVKNFLLIDLERKAEKIKEHILEMNHDSINISISHQVHDIQDSDIIIAATNSPEVVIRSEDLKPGAIVVNDAQPSDVSPDVIQLRRDVLIIEGGVIHSPGIRCNVNMGLVGREDTFCCLGEVLILAHHHHYKHFALGELDLNLIEKIEKLSEPLNITLAKFQNSQGLISEDQIESVHQIIASSRNK